MITGKKKHSNILSIAIALIACLSCNKQMNTAPSSAAGETSEWKTIDDTRSNLFGVYALFRGTLANNNDFWIWGELRQGDFVSSSRTDLTAVINGNLNASYPIVEDAKDWRRFYAVINAASLFIERSAEALADSRYTTLNHDVDVAQMRVLRAWAYFMMARIWGDVPLITSSYDNGTFPAVSRSPQAQVLSFCESEILNAAQVLPFEYGVAGDPLFPGDYYTFDNTKYANSLITRVAAYALLSHIAAWQGHYSDVDVYTQFVMNNMALSNLNYVSTSDLTASNGIFYGLGSASDGSYDQMIGFNFIYNNGEAGSSGTGHIESLTLASPMITKPVPDMYVPKDTINTVFTDPNDQRFGYDTVNFLPTTNYFINYSTDMPIFSKIKVIGNGTSNGTFAVYSSAIIFSRIEEIALLRAEALTILNKPTDAIVLLNNVRSERDEKAYTASDGDLLNAIFAERRRELMGEGWRWYDLVRYNRIKRNNAAFNKLIDEGGIYWPVSQSAMSVNKQITQNPYWQANAN